MDLEYLYRSAGGAETQSASCRSVQYPSKRCLTCATGTNETSPADPKSSYQCASCHLAAYGEPRPHHKSTTKRCLTCSKSKSTVAATYQCRACRRVASANSRISAVRSFLKKCKSCCKVKSTPLDEYQCRSCRNARPTTPRRFRGKSTRKKCVTCDRMRSTPFSVYQCRACRNAAGLGGPTRSRPSRKASILDDQAGPQSFLGLDADEHAGAEADESLAWNSLDYATDLVTGSNLSLEYGQPGFRIPPSVDIRILTEDDFRRRLEATHSGWNKYDWTHS